MITLIVRIMINNHYLFMNNLSFISHNENLKEMNRFQ